MTKTLMETGGMMRVVLQLSSSLYGRTEYQMKSGWCWLCHYNSPAATVHIFHTHGWLVALLHQKRPGRNSIIIIIIKQESNSTPCQAVNRG
jgi:hypothetical protein